MVLGRSLRYSRRVISFESYRALCVTLLCAQVKVRAAKGRQITGKMTCTFEITKGTKFESSLVGDQHADNAGYCRRQLS